MGEDIFSEEDTPLEVIIGELLKKKNLTVSTAESCTGGSIAARLTSIAGSSEYFNGGVVAYSNEVKMNPCTFHRKHWKCMALLVSRL